MAKYFENVNPTRDDNRLLDLRISAFYGEIVEVSDEVGASLAHQSIWKQREKKDFDAQEAAKREAEKAENEAKQSKAEAK